MAPDGIVLGRFEYYAQGRMTALIDLQVNRLSKTVFRTTSSGRVAMTTTNEYNSRSHKIRNFLLVV